MTRTLWRCTPSLVSQTIVRAPAAACRMALLISLYGPLSKRQAIKFFPDGSRGSATRAWNQAREHQLIEEAPVASLPLQPASSKPAPVAPGPASGWPEWSHMESGPGPASHMESGPGPASHMESGPGPASHMESGHTSLSDSVSSNSQIPRVTTTPPTSTQSGTVTSNNARQAWQRAQAALALQLTTGEYDTLVGPCRFFSYENGELKLLAPNSVARDLLGNRLRPWLKEHLAQLLGTYVDIHIILDATAPAESPDTPDTPELVRADLVAAGVWTDIAHRLVRDHGMEACRRQLIALESLQRAVIIEKPGGWLTRAIEQTWMHGDGIAS